MEDAIERRLEILDQLLHRSVECDDENVCLSLVAKEGLLDSLLLLYDECHEHLLQNNKLVAAFVKKCKILTLFMVNKLLWHINFLTARPRGYKTFFMFNSTENKISTAHKS